MKHEELVSIGRVIASEIHQFDNRTAEMNRRHARYEAFVKDNVQLVALMESLRAALGEACDIAERAIRAIPAPHDMSGDEELVSLGKYRELLK